MRALEEYDFKVYEISCGGTEEGISVSRSGAWLVIEGAVNIPDPCHSIKVFPELDVATNTLKIHMKASKMKVFCIQCLAKAKFRIKINIFHLRQRVRKKTVRLYVDYYVKGRSAVMHDADIEI